MHRFSKIGLLVSILSVFMFPSCHKVEVFEDDPYGNFDALWTILDERYCFFEYKNDIYIFIKEKETVGRFFCRSFFPKEKKDYTIGQPQYTLLFKEKITVSTGEKIIQYDRLTPKNKPASIPPQEIPEKGQAE